MFDPSTTTGPDTYQDAPTDASAAADAQSPEIAAALARSTLKAGHIVKGINPRRTDRKKRNPGKWNQFVQTIKDKGVLQPVLVRYVPDLDQYHLIAGYGRLDGVLEAHGHEYDMPVRVILADDEEALAFALIENMHREEMNSVEEAESIAQMLAEFRSDRQEVARRLGLSLATVERRLALLNCSDAVRDAFIEGKISLGHAELLAAVPKAQQDEVLAKLEKLPAMCTVAQLKEQLQLAARPLAVACFDKAECGTCMHNSDLQSQMFAESVTQGNCTNRSCYEKKTQDVIQARLQELKDDFPRVQSVKPGENYTVIKIVPDGPRGVGAEQAEACRSCKDFGAAVSEVPGKEGIVYRDQCFNPSCNTLKVAAFLKSQEPATETQTSEEKGDSKTNAKSGGKPAPKPNGVTASVQQYRAALWREALIAELSVDATRSLQLLVTMALTNNAGKIDTTRSCESFKAVTGQKVNFSFDQVKPALESVKALPKEHLSQLILALPRAGVQSMSDKAVCAALKSFDVDLNKHFKLGEDYFKLLTKSEIEAVAKEVGLSKAMGDRFKGLAAKKKDEMIKELLAVSDFDYAVAPKALQPSL